MPRAEAPFDSPDRAALIQSAVGRAEYQEVARGGPLEVQIRLFDRVVQGAIQASQRESVSMSLHALDATDARHYREGVAAGDACRDLMAIARWFASPLGRLCLEAGLDPTPVREVANTLGRAGGGLSRLCSKWPELRARIQVLADTAERGNRTSTAKHMSAKGAREEAAIGYLTRIWRNEQRVATLEECARAAGCTKQAATKWHILRTTRKGLIAQMKTGQAGRRRGTYDARTERTEAVDPDAVDQSG